LLHHARERTVGNQRAWAAGVDGIQALLQIGQGAWAVVTQVDGVVGHTAKGVQRRWPVRARAGSTREAAKKVLEPPRISSWQAARSN
jgi:hypothetical protein